MILIPWENMFPWQIFHVLFHKHLQTWLQLGFGVRGLPSSSGSQFMGGSRQPRNLHDRKCSASFPISESDTLPLRRCPSVSLIKDNCPQTLIFTGPRTQMWHALSIFRTWPLSLLPARQPRGCLLPIPTCRSSLPDWTPLITCQLDWLQVFIICDDWADLEANLNQGCWRTEESIAAAAADLDPSSPQEVYSSLCSVLTSCYPQASLQTLANIRSVCVQASKVLLQNEWGALSPPPSAVVDHQNESSSFGGNFSLSCVLCTRAIRLFTGWWLCGSAIDVVEDHGEKRLGEIHIAVMTIVWQQSAAEECMDGILLLIKEIFLSISWYFTDSLLLLSILHDLSTETWLSTPELGCSESMLSNMYEWPHITWKGLIKICSSSRNRTANTCFVLKMI